MCCFVLLGGVWGPVSMWCDHQLLYNTCAIIMLSKQYIDMAHLWRWLDYLSKGEVLSIIDLDRFVNNIWEKFLFSESVKFHHYFWIKVPFYAFPLQIKCLPSDAELTSLEIFCKLMYNWTSYNFTTVQRIAFPHEALLIMLKQFSLRPSKSNDISTIVYFGR